MGRLKQFTIPFEGLAPGRHQFEYDIDDSFFTLFEKAVIQKAQVHIDLDLLKATESLTLLFKFKGTVEVTCDRCLEPFQLPVDQQQGILVKFGTAEQGVDDDVVVIDRSEHEINVAQHIYDFISLLRPMRVVHPDLPDGTPGCSNNIADIIQEEDEEKDTTDPRWAALKNIKVSDN